MVAKGEREQADKEKESKRIGLALACPAVKGEREQAD
jgi:hypothetical protein